MAIDFAQAIRQAFTGEQRAELLARGARVEIRGIVHQQLDGGHMRQLPAGGRGQKLNSEAVESVVESCSAQDRTTVETFLDHFGDSYGLRPDEVTDLESLTVWPDGSDRPIR
jgi:hypothetical protein